MGKIKRHNPVKLIAGFIYKDEAIFFKAREQLKKKFGSIDFESAALDFSCTAYYEPEMGKGLKRKFVSFKRPTAPQDLYRVKIYTNRLEARFKENSKRLINIDPGYMDLAKLILASTKDYCHRIYLRKGIFAEIALSFRGVSFVPLEWTYPDYRSKEYIDIFNKIRQTICCAK